MSTHAFSMTASKAGDYIELTKPRLVTLVLFSTMVGFWMGNEGALSLPLFLVTLFGTALVAAGSMTLNQWMEREQDAKMPRTAARPLPSQRLSAREALIFGSLLSVTGLILLTVFVNMIAAFLAGLTLISYLFLYTPLKLKTSLCTVVGAVPGALPPLIGWAAVQGQPSFQAWILFAIIFLWQMPHFLAIAWLCRKEYSDAGFYMLSREEGSAEVVASQILIYSLALLPVSLLPTITGMTGTLYFVAALIAGIGWIFYSLQALKNLNKIARQLFRVSILHLTVLLLLMLINKA